MDPDEPADERPGGPETEPAISTAEPEGPLEELAEDDATDGEPSKLLEARPGVPEDIDPDMPTELPGGDKRDK